MAIYNERTQCDQNVTISETQGRRLSNNPKVVRIVHKLYQIRSRELASSLIELSRLGVKLPVAKNDSQI